jgi:hypothetical protein
MLCRKRKEVLTVMSNKRFLLILVIVAMVLTWITVTLKVIDQQQTEHNLEFHSELSTAHLNDR